MELKRRDLSVDLAGLRLKNPVMTASGTCGYGKELSEWIDLSKLGALVVKGLSLMPKIGNPIPRTCETPAGMLNAIGLENIGVEAFKRDIIPFLNGVDTPVVVNFFGNTTEEYIRLAEILDDTERVDALEVNISCPNVKEGGIVFGTDPKITYELIHTLRAIVKNKPLIVKLSPNVTNIVEMARAVEDAGADIISLINTLLGMSINVDKRRPLLANTTGGLSGPAIRPVAVRMVWQVASSVKVPVIGMGGIQSAEDALEFLIAGAKAVAIGTMTMVNPNSLINVIEGIDAYMEKHSFCSIDEVTGSLDLLS